MTVITQEPLALARRGAALVRHTEERAVTALRRVGLTLLRISLSLVFIWFGALKIANVTPVGDLVAGTLPFVDPVWFVPVLGGVEVALGLGLLLGPGDHRRQRSPGRAPLRHVPRAGGAARAGLPGRQPAAADHHR